MTVEEKAKERLAKFQMAKKKAEEEKNSHSSFPKEEVPEFKCCVLDKEKPKIIRLIGNSPLMREDPTDPLIVKRSMCIDDEGKWTTVILSDDREHPVNRLFRTIIGKYKFDKDTKTRTYDNAGKPSFERFMTNGKSKDQIGAFERGMQADTYYMFNCIDKTDDWCKENKHTKLLCWESKNKEVDGKIRTYYTYGVKPSFYNEIFDVQCTKLNRMYDQFDVVAKRLKEKLGDSYLTVLCPEEKSAIGNMGLDASKVTMDYLTEEEEAYERYKLEDIPFITRPTSAGYFLSAFKSLIRSADADFNKGEPVLYNAFVEWKEKELAELKKKNAENEGQNSVQENEVEENSDVEVDETESNELPSEVEENVQSTPTTEVKKVVKMTKAFDPMSLVDKYPAIANMREEDRKLIIGYNEETDEFKYSTDILAECPSCSKTIPDSWHSCSCGVQFE